jgi:hypothetical protein
MMTRKTISTAGLLTLLWAPLLAAGVIVYPANNQSPEQQQRDQGECLGWASQQTGFDPTAPLEASAPPPPVTAPTTSAGRGLVRGALVGVTVGAITGKAGKGAAVGAASGALVGGMRRRGQVNNSYAQQQAWANDQAVQYQQKQVDFNRAYGVCLQGRGYTVSL